ncbi:hypothetical protein HYC85_020122 [Camellia sinensis]|uniref:Malectin-like domain-containing protein n=1 Tax=Camellia sinensis TaxID=4442 RepID=A0A7J7GP54_CAMSI|nr:hypothetical protein HYC85_020122 [Camellia sinensis]
MKFSVCSYALVVVVVIVENSGISNSFCMLCGVPPDPTNGFTNVALTEYNFELQKPYDIPLEQRYSYYNGIHGATNYTTTIILRIYNGDMRYYSGDLVDTDLYDKWFRVNLIHDVYKRNLTVFIDVAGDHHRLHVDVPLPKLRRDTGLPCVWFQSPAIPNHKIGHDF